MIRLFQKPECPLCGSDQVTANVIRKGLPAVFTCWMCGTKFNSNGVILWAPGKEAQRANG